MSTNCLCNTKDKMILSDAPEPVIMEASFCFYFSRLELQQANTIFS